MNFNTIISETFRQKCLLTAFNRLLITRRHMTANASIQDDENEVVFECRNGRGIITLNKPKALNAINCAMVCRITEKMQEWESTMDMVIIKGTGRAFCSGGDVVSITKGGPSEAEKGRQFFKHEYIMNNFIGTYTKPYVALIDGITMGGGLGLSVHGRYRVATENTMCAMPETGIGLFPDVGGTYFLSRLSGGLGTFLGLTGYRLKGVDVVKAGIANLYCPKNALPALYNALINKIDPCNIDNEIGAYTTNVESYGFTLDRFIPIIDSIFILNTIEEILEALEKDGSDFCLKQLAILKKMSPIALKLTLKGLQKGKDQTLQECLQMEYRMANVTLDATVSSDFYEGVRALLIDKNKKPAWCPKLEDITDAMVEKYFLPLGDDNELKI